MEEKESFLNIKKLADIFLALNDEDRWKIMMMLRKAAEKNISYSEIKGCLGNNYNDNRLWRHLRKLIQAGLIINERKVIFNPETGKARTSFYRLSEIAQKVFKELPHLKMILERASSPSFYRGKILIFL